MEGAGHLERADASATEVLHCNLCLIYERQQAQDLLVKTVGGPTPTQLLQMLADSKAWYLVLAQATPEEKLSAHMRLKRRMDFTTTEQELSQSLSLHDPIAAFVVDRLGNQDSNSVGAKTLEAFVTQKVPSIKYKQLLLPEFGGSMARARQHFQEQMKSQDKLVAALACERDFLCSFVEKQLIAPPKRAKKFELTDLETPMHGLVWLRYMFKALSQRLKKASARSESDLMLVRAWYSDVMMLAHSHTQDHIFKMASSVAGKRTMVQNVDMPFKRQLVQPVSRASSAASQDDTPVLRAANGLTFSCPRVAVDWFHPNISGKKTEAIYRENVTKHFKAFKTVFAKVCKNCWLGGRGTVVHSTMDCMNSGNPCSLPCPNCKTEKHWVQNCPQKKNHSK